ncbi:MAG: hypothetical protein QM736_17215 [Vicinamibacterales bacterium]
MKTSMRIVASVIALVLVAGAASAQGRPPRRNGPPGQDGVSPAEIQRLFDAYVVMQAQQELQLSDEQYPKFLTQLKAFQEYRQRNLRERARLLQQLRQSVEKGDEAQLSAQVKALDAQSSSFESGLVAARQHIDDLLTPVQRAKFRLFEEQMERRKVDLLMRARQANRARNQP